MRDEIQRIVDLIHIAFHGVQRGEITIHEAEIIDNYGTVEERAAARREDVEPEWEEIPDGFIEACSNGLPHLDPKSWCYYLPRYMEWTVQHLTRSHSMTVDHTIYTLLLGDDWSLNEYMRRRYGQLTSAQCEAVGMFLSHMARHDAHCDARAASEALNRSWQRFVG
jgi:hypothetical protein